MSTEAAAAEGHETPGHDGHGHDDHGHHGPKWLQHHFDTPAQQFETAKLGMWVFLVQEILFFSGLFVAYGVFRNWYPEMFVAASHQLNKEMGATNTVVLLFSSFTAVCHSLNLATDSFAARTTAGSFERSLGRKRFFASCWVIVLPPPVFCPSMIVLTNTLASPRKSIPECL